MAKLFSCNTPAINVKSEDIGTAKATTTSTRKRPRVTTPSVIVIEDDDDDDDDDNLMEQQQQQQQSSFSSFTLGSKQELQLIAKGTAVSIYNKNKIKKYMSLTAIQWIKLTSSWKNIDKKLKSYIRNTQGNISKKIQPDSTTGNSRHIGNIDFYMTLLNGRPYCNASEGVRYYLSYMPSFEHMFIKGSGISLCYDEWIHLLALIPAKVQSIMNLMFMTTDLGYYDSVIIIHLNSNTFNHIKVNEIDNLYCLHLHLTIK